MAQNNPASETARRLLRDTKRASGGDAWDGVQALHLRSTIQQGGLHGTLEQWQDARTGHYAQSHRLGITAGGEGFDGALPWSQDSAGYPRPEENGNAEEGAANSAYRTCLAWWYPERWRSTQEYVGETQGDNPCHVVRLTPDGGRPFDLWINVATALIERTVERGAFETITRRFSDCRAVGGLRVPFHIRTSNGHTRYDQEQKVQQVELNPLGAETHLRMPPLPVVPDFRIAGAQDSAEMPFRLVGGLILVDVSVDGRGVLPFILDTGGVSLVTPETAQGLGLEPQGSFWGMGGGEEAVDMRAAAVASLEFGGVQLSDQVVWVYPFPDLKEALGIAEFGGLLGYEVFRRLVVRVDYQHQRLTFTRPEHYDPRGSGTVVPFLFHGNIPEVEGALDGVPGRFDLDTGNTGALILNAPFVEQHGLAARYGAVEIKTGKGAGGGAISFLVAQARRLRLGGVEVEDLPFALSLHRSGALSNPYAAGLVGAELFQRFVMTFDYSRQQIVFEERGSA